jgi:cell division protein FtsQ
MTPKAPPRHAAQKPRERQSAGRQHASEQSAPPRPGPDARIVERRADVARAARRRRLAGVGAIAVIVAFVASAFAVLHSPIFSARHLDVTGAGHEKTDQILAAAGLAGHPPLIDVNPARATAGIETLPWVAHATVSRHWPVTLDVAVTERVPVGVVRRSGGPSAVLDAAGRVLERVAQTPKGLVDLADVGRVPPPGGRLGATGRAVTSLAAAVPDSIRPFVSSVGWSRQAGLTLTLSAGPNVLIGPSSGFAEKFTALATLLTSERQTTLSAHLVDLRVPSSPVLTP